MCMEQVERLVASRQPYRLYDVREPSETVSGMIPTALSLPLSELQPAQIQELAGCRDLLCFYCEKGGRAERVANLVAAHRPADVHYYPGSMAEWRTKHHP